MNSGEIVLLVIIAIVVVVVLLYNLIKHMNKERDKKDFEEFCQRQGVQFELVSNDVNICFFVHPNHKQFGTDFSGKLFDFEDVFGFSRRVVCLAEKPETCVCHDLRISFYEYADGERTNHARKEDMILGYGKENVSIYSEKYSKRKQMIEKIFDIFDQYTYPFVWKKYEKCHFIPTQEFHYDGMIVAFEKETKRVALRENWAVCVEPQIYSKNDILRYKKENKLNKYSNGSYFAVSTGNITMGSVSDAKYVVKNMEVVVYTADAPSTSDTFNHQFTFLSNNDCQVGSTYYEFQKGKMEELIGLLDYILKAL